MQRRFKPGAAVIKKAALPFLGKAATKIFDVI
jgi:hypothetical protein